MTGNESPCVLAAGCARANVRASDLDDRPGSVEATWAGTAVETQIRLERHERAARATLNGGRAAVVTESANQSDAGRDEGEEKVNVREGGVNEEVERANE